MLRWYNVNDEITYDKMFEYLNVKDIIIFEDTFAPQYGKNAICYGVARMSKANRTQMLLELSEIQSDLKVQLEEFANAFDGVFDAIECWETEVPINDIETAFEVIQENARYSTKMLQVWDKYSAINLEKYSGDNKIGNLLVSYGVGVEIPNGYDELFDEYICKNAQWKSFRIFREFSAYIQSAFEKHIDNFSDIKGTTICIVDDQLKKEKCSKDIVECVRKIQLGLGEKQRISGIIYSSFDNEDCINEDVFFEYIPKDSSKKKIQSALVKSSYSYMLSDLKAIYEQILGDAFDQAVKSKNIAYYLSCMADYEGVTNYQVITNWIKLLFEYKLSDADDLKTVARMTRLIGLLEDEKVEFEKEMLNLNTFEAFDFSVNKYREPIASGDVFLIKKTLYILVGQDCDMANSATRTRKNGISELVMASAINQSQVDNAVKLNDQFMFISNFKKEIEAETKILRIKYSSRNFIENQILQICQFNDEGIAILNLDQEQYDSNGVEPAYYEGLYANLISYYKALLQISETAKSALELIVKNDQSNRILALTDYKQTSSEKNVIEYRVRRICRLRHPYMLYLYKMYLEHQGRHPFDCMNMSRVQEIQVKLVGVDAGYVTVDTVLTPDRDINRKCLEKMEWYIDTANLQKAVYNVLGENAQVQDERPYIEVIDTPTAFDCVLESGERRHMCILKVKNQISIVECESQ